MSGDYESLTQFVRRVLVDPGLPFNSLSTTTSAIASITSRFSSLGWTVTPVTDEKSRQQRHEVQSPDGNIVLKMNGAKVFRHPMHTEQICQRKHLTKRMLEFDSLPTPAGADFSSKEQGVARAYFSKVPKPVVIKPTNSGGSHGVSVGVSDIDAFENAWRYAVDEGGTGSNILVEQFVRGVELRALVVGSEVVSFVARIQPFVVGDGKKPLKHLIDEARQARTVHYRATQLPVVVNWGFLERNGFQDDTVPSEGDVVYLNPLALPADGALLVDVSESVSPEVVQLAVRAKDSIPDLEVGGIDILITDLQDVATAVILEVNTAPSLNLHRYATHGTPRDVELDIVDYFHSQYLKSI